MTLPEQYTDLEMCDILIVDNRNEYTKAKIMERLQRRSLIRAEGGEAMKKILAATQSRVSHLKNMLDELVSIRESIAKEAEEAAQPTKA